MNASGGNASADRRSFPERSGYQHLEQGELRLLIPAALGIICALGFAGNLTAMGVLISNARRSKLSLINALLLNLLLADGLVLALAGPFKAVAYARASWTLGLLVCRSCDWVLHSCMAAKSFTLAVMAKACLRYVSNPTQQVSIRRKAMLAALALCWALAGSVALPQLLFSALRSTAGGLMCVQEVPARARPLMALYLKAYPLLAYCAPLSVSLLYFWRAYGRCQRRCSKTQNLRTQIRSRKLTLMLLGLTLAAAALWLPHWVSWLWTRLALESDAALPPLPFSLSAQLLMFALSLADPLIVLALSEEFREGYIGLWRRLTLRKQPNKHKPGPHTPSAPRSPAPRPETAAHPPQAPETQEPESPGNRDGMVLQDVEQFWQERESGSQTQENDPVPWEHQHSTAGGQ